MFRTNFNETALIKWMSQSEKLQITRHRIEIEIIDVRLFSVL